MLVLVGTLVHSTWEDPLVIMEDTSIGVNDGKIVFVASKDGLKDLQENHGFQDGDVHYLSSGEFLIPGFVDTHIHAPQYVNAGIGMDLPLLEWLEKYTFPAEVNFSNIEFARLAYDKVVKRVLKNGTTTACYFATIDVEATLELCRIVGKVGQRALVGKVCMNQDSPKDYCETTQESVEGTERFIRSVQSLGNPLVQPIVTPRFALSCNQELLQSLGNLALKENIHIQSHISENKTEVELVRKAYPKNCSYADVYYQNGLLNDKTIMAHGIYLDDSELQLFQKTGASIAHCPNSNCSLSSGLCDVRRLLDNHIKVGLGTDVSGGYSPSMLDAIRHTTMVSNLVSLEKGPQYKNVDYREAFRLATLGGSRALSMDSIIGNFEVGKQFDALRVDVGVADSPLDTFDGDTVQDVFQKFIYLGDDRNIKEVYVAGRKVIFAESSPTNCQ